MFDSLKGFEAVPFVWTTCIYNICYQIFLSKTDGDDVDDDLNVNTDHFVPIRKISVLTFKSSSPSVFDKKIW